MNKVLPISALLLFAALLSACGPAAPQASAGTNADRQRIADLEKKLAGDEEALARLQEELAANERAFSALQAEAEASGIRDVSVAYSDYGRKRVFVPGVADMLWAPYGGAPRAAQVPSNSVVEVLFAGDAGDGLWLYILFPTYDAPSDNRGWLRESDTEVYTEATRAYVQGDVYVPAGTLVADAASGDRIRLESDARGRIVARDRGRVRIAAAGGLEFWVDSRLVSYPEID
jgi:hypothetical protein